LKLRPIMVGTLTMALLLNGVAPLSYGATTAQAASVVKTNAMSVDEAMQKAKAYSMQIRQITAAKESAMRGYSAAESGGAKAGNMLYEYNVFQKLSENGATDPMQVATLEMYRAMFGGSPSLSFEQMYDQFIIPSEVSPYKVYVQYQGLKLDEPSVISGVEYQTKQMYYGILSYKHSLLLMQESIGITQKKIQELELKYKAGQVAKATLEMEKLTYSKNLLELDKQKKELKILETSFNGLLGNADNAPVVLKEVGLLNAPGVISYETLVLQAFQNRADLKKSQLEIDSLTHEVKIMSGYLRDPKLDRRIDADQRLLSAKLAKMTLENNVKTEILDAYNTYKLAQEQLSISAKKVALSEKQLSKIKQLLKVGYAKKLDVFGVELQLQNSKLGYESAVYEYNKQLDAISRITVHALN
jgi:hypothetical protein